MIGADEIRTVAQAALDLRGADGVEVLVIHRRGGLTRFANSSIHQSTAQEDAGVRVRVVSDGRIGVTASNDFSPEGARAAAESALEMAGVVAPDPDFPGLAPPAPIPKRDGFDTATAEMDPERRAEAVAAAVAQVESGFHAAGALQTGTLEVALANTEGQFCHGGYTHASMSMVASGGDGGAGAVEISAGSASEIDPEAVGLRAFAKARDGQGPFDADPGRYEVVLEPMAVDTLVSFLAYMGFSGRAIAEGRSPFSSKEGQQVAAPSVTIVDDALSPVTIGLPFDFEGTPKERLALIEGGVFRQGVHDRRSAKLAGTRSTGHALPSPNPDGAFPLNLFLERGDATLDDMIASTTRGLLVTRFHYSNIVHPIETVITGMTRDGTWLIENGRVAHPVKNLRFTQSILEALQAVEMVGRESVIANEFTFAATRVPALKISSFNFSGAGDH